MSRRRKMEEELTCPICMELFDQPRRLPCGHSYCTSCIRSMIDSHAEMSGQYLNYFRPLVCPECRAELCVDFVQGVEGIPLDFKLSRLAELVQFLKTESSSESSSSDVPNSVKSSKKGKRLHCSTEGVGSELREAVNSSPVSSRPTIGATIPAVAESSGLSERSETAVLSSEPVTRTLPTRLSDTSTTQGPSPHTVTVNPSTIRTHNSAEIANRSSTSTHVDTAEREGNNSDDLRQASTVPTNLTSAGATSPHLQSQSQNNLFDLRLTGGEHQTANVNQGQDSSPCQDNSRASSLPALKKRGPAQSRSDLAQSGVVPSSLTSLPASSTTPTLCGAEGGLQSTSPHTNTASSTQGLKTSLPSANKLKKSRPRWKNLFRNSALYSSSSSSSSSLSSSTSDSDSDDDRDCNGAKRKYFWSVDTSSDEVKVADPSSCVASNSVTEASSSNQNIDVQADASSNLKASKKTGRKRRGLMTRFLRSVVFSDSSSSYSDGDDSDRDGDSSTVVNKSTQRQTSTNNRQVSGSAHTVHPSQSLPNICRESSLSTVAQRGNSETDINRSKVMQEGSAQLGNNIVAVNEPEALGRNTSVREGQGAHASQGAEVRNRPSVSSETTPKGDFEGSVLVERNSGNAQVDTQTHIENRSIGLAEPEGIPAVTLDGDSPRTFYDNLSLPHVNLCNNLSGQNNMASDNNTGDNPIPCNINSSNNPLVQDNLPGAGGTTSILSSETSRYDNTSGNMDHYNPEGISPPAINETPAFSSTRVLNNHERSGDGLVVNERGQIHFSCTETSNLSPTLYDNVDGENHLWSVIDGARGIIEEATDIEELKTGFEHLEAQHLYRSQQSLAHLGVQSVVQQAEGKAFVSGSDEAEMGVNSLVSSVAEPSLLPGGGESVVSNARSCDAVDESQSLSVNGQHAAADLVELCSNKESSVGGASGLDFERQNHRHNAIISRPDLYTTARTELGSAVNLYSETSNVTHSSPINTKTENLTTTNTATAGECSFLEPCQQVEGQETNNNDIITNASKTSQGTDNQHDDRTSGARGCNNSGGDSDNPTANVCDDIEEEKEDHSTSDARGCINDSGGHNSNPSANVCGDSEEEEEDVESSSTKLLTRRKKPRSRLTRFLTSLLSLSSSSSSDEDLDGGSGAGVTSSKSSDW